MTPKRYLEDLKRARAKRRRSILGWHFRYSFVSTADYWSTPCVQFTRANQIGIPCGRLDCRQEPIQIPASLSFELGPWSFILEMRRA